MLPPNIQVGSESRESGTMRLRVDAERCMGNAVCIRIAPGSFRLDDDGYAYAIDELVDENLVAAVIEATRLCPTNAIEIDET